MHHQMMMVLISVKKHNSHSYVYNKQGHPVKYLIPTRSCLKNALSFRDDTPICWKTRKILLAEVPAISMAKQSKKFPAGILVPDIQGWLFHVCSFRVHVGLVQVLLTVTIVPTSLASTVGFSALHQWQN